MHNYSKSKSIPAILAGFLTVFTLLSFVLLSSSYTFAANTGNIDASVSVTAACSLSVNGISHSASVIPGNSVNIGTSTVTAICNDPSGLAVYTVGYTGDSYGNNNLTTTINETDYSIPSGAASPATTSQWNMTVTPVSGTYAPTIVSEFDDTAHIIPTQYTKVAYRNTITDLGTGASGAKFEADFNAYVDMTQVAATYTGKVKFLLIHPNVLTWQEDPQNPGTMIPDEVQPSILPCEPAEYDTFDTSATHYLQNVSQWENQVALEQEVTAYDNRDGQAYKVRRLKMSANGCETALWMSNLNLGAEALTVSQLDNTNTHLASDVSAIPTTTFNSWIKSSGTGSYTEPELISIKSSNTCTIYDSNWNPSTISCPEQDSYGNKYGTLYNYAAASAGTYTYAEGAGTGNATSDLCPFGWRLPTGGNSGELKTLIDSYGLSTNWNTTGFVSMQQTSGFSLAGGFFDGVPYDQGTRGNYWSSTFYDGNSVYDMNILGFDESYLLPAFSYGRYYGTSIRCIAQ